MPKQYEAIRDRLIREGASRKEAETRAAKIYNAKHPNGPVGPKSHGTKKPKRSKK